MTSIRRQRVWTQKPPLCARINWGHKFAQGLLGFWPLNEFAGFPSELVTKALASDSQNAANYGWAKSSDGIGLNAVQTSGPIISLNHSAFDSGTNCTVLLWMTISAFRASSPYISGLWVDTIVTSTSAKQLFRFGDSTLANNQFQIVYNLANKSASSASYATGFHLVGMSCSPVNGGNITQTGWVDGIAACVQTTAYAQNIVAATSLFRDDSTGREPSGICHAVGIWSPMLDPITIGNLGAYPNAIWQMFQPAAGAWVMPGVGTAAGASSYWGRSVNRPKSRPIEGPSIPLIYG